MIIENQNKPRIRFKAFTDAWEQRTFKDVLKSHSFRQYLAEPEDEGEFEIIQQGDKPIIGCSDGKPFTEFADVILFGDHTVSLYKPSKPFFVATDGVKIISANGFNGQYLFATLERYKPEPQGYKRHFNILKNEDFWLTKNSDEQVKIGNFFNQLDQLITLHQRKLEQLSTTKKTFLNKMFTNKNEVTPEYRFDGFAEDWEQHELGNVSDIISGGTPRTSNYEYWNGDIDWYSPVEIGEQIYVSRSQKKITKLGLDKSSAKILPVGTVLFTSRAGIGNTAILAKEGCTNQGFQSIVPHENELDSYFIYSRTHELKRYGELMGAGSTFVEVSGKQMSKMPISLPKIEEQKQIGDFFSTLDNLITLHQCKLDKLEEIKKYFLKNMFV